MGAAVKWLQVILVVIGGLSGKAQQATPTPKEALQEVKKDAPAPVEHRDPVLDEASNQIGRALFLRCFCASNTLAFDAQGHLDSPKAEQAKTTDWTLAAVNVLKAERKATGEIELDGVRVAIRYAPDRHEFDRHPLNDETVKILVADTGDAKAFERTLATVFATGIDRPLQRSMPEFWQHYFDPQKPWEKDALTGQTIASPLETARPESEGTNVIVKHRAEPSPTDAALHDHVQGQVSVRGVVDAEGELRRISVVQPLGYGLEAKVIEALKKYQFSPATQVGKPVAMNVLLRQDFVLVAPPK